MTDPTVLAATWSDGVFVFAGETRQQELAAQSVYALKSDSHRGALAIIDGHSICKDDTEGSWRTIATHDSALACLVTVGKAIYVGTDDDARILYLSGDSKFSGVPASIQWRVAIHGMRDCGCQRPIGIETVRRTPKHGFPPEKQWNSTQTVVEQEEILFGGRALEG